MFKTLLALGLVCLGGFSNLKSAETKYVNYEGFYRFEVDTASLTSWAQGVSVGTQINYSGSTLDNFYYALFDAETLEFAFQYNTNQSKPLYCDLIVNKVDANSFRIGFNYDDQSHYFYSYSYNYGTGVVGYNNIIYLQGFRFDVNSCPYFSLVNYDVTEGGSLINQTANLYNFNPVGFLGQNYKDNPYLSDIYGINVDYLDNLIVIYNGYKVTDIKSYWFSADNTYYYDGSSFSKIGTSSAKQCYSFTHIEYYSNGTLVSDVFSQSVWQNRISNGEIVGSAYTNQLSNIYGDIRIIGVAGDNDGNNKFVKSFSSYELSHGGGGNYGNIGDVFSLIGKAFTGFGSFFGMSLIPGISIGALVVTPLLVGLLLWLIKLFKRG